MLPHFREYGDVRSPDAVSHLKLEDDMGHCYLVG